MKRVRARSDTAGYQHDLMKYCDRGDDPRFGRIDFAFSSDVSSEFRKAVSDVAEKDWHPMCRTVHGRIVETGVQWAEVCFVPNAIAHSKNGPAYRYLTTREAMRESVLPGLASQQELPRVIHGASSRGRRDGPATRRGVQARLSLSGDR